MKNLYLQNAIVLDENAALKKSDILISGGIIEKIIPREEKKIVRKRNTLPGCEAETEKQGSSMQEAGVRQTGAAKTGAAKSGTAKNGAAKSGPASEAAVRELMENAQVIDCSGRLISPGFTILHAHSPMHILRGLAEDVNIDDWFNKEIWPYESRITPEDVRCGAMLCMAEMIDCGVTAFADHYFQGEAILEAAVKTGIRIDLAPTIFCPEGSPKEGIAGTERLMEKYAGNEKVHIRFGPHSPYTVHPEALKEICAEAKKMHTGIHLHVSETREQVRESKRKYGMTPVAELFSLGGMEVPCILAHALYIEEEDLTYLKKDTFIASSPKTYMKLGMGYGSIWKLDGKIRRCHAVGTDGAASSNTVDALEEARLYALIGKAENHAEEFTKKEIWKLLMNGASAMPFRTGKIREGYQADLIFWNRMSPRMAPLYDPLASILYSASAAKDIADVMIGGRFVKRNGKLKIDMPPLLAEAGRRAEEITVRGRGKSRVSF